MEIKHNLRIPPEKLRRLCRPDELDFDNTTKVKPLMDFIGQERAVKAMQFGLSMRAPGYNIFVSGPTGTGKSTYTKAVLFEHASDKPVPYDWCFLYNFHNPDQPVSVNLPPGLGAQLQSDMNELIAELWDTIPKTFEGEAYEQKKQAILQRLEDGIENRLNKLRQEATEAGFQMNQTQSGFLFIPVREGKRMTPEEFEELSEDHRQDIEKRGRVLQQRAEETLNEGKTLDKEAKNSIQELDKEIGLITVGPMVNKLLEKYIKHPLVIKYLQEVLDDITKHLDSFKPAEPPANPAAGYGSLCHDDDPTSRYKVNLFVNNSDTTGAPVVFETSPNYYNLFGKIEYQSQMGTLNTNFTMIKAGAIHRANGGYLVLQARDVLSDPGVWETLKRTLKNNEAIIENIGEQYRMVPTASLRPEPIPLNIKLVLIGNPVVYQLLLSYDEDFRKFFKVKVDFDTEMPRTRENITHYAALVGSVCRRENLTHFDRTGMARLIEFGSRLAGDQTKLSTRFNEVIEIVYEASAQAENQGSEFVSAPHVIQAIEQRAYQCNRIEEKIQEMIARGKILVDTRGTAVGQVNGLSVLDIGDHVFGRPSRITAKTFMGQEGVVNIEREIHMSGSIHSKGVLTLAGFLGDRFAQDKPLRLSARLTFEQLYEGVDGDSASSAELYAILSSLSGIPVNQGLAVTGSVNQHGQIQPIGGATEKIEGFFAVCEAQGLTGEQGVLIPAQNVDSLMLKEEITRAVEQGKFHIYAVSTIEEGIEILTGRAAGQRNDQGEYHEGTIYHLVDGKLREFARGMMRFAAHQEGGGQDKCGGDCSN